MTELFERWARKNKYSIATDDDVKAVRDEFIEAHHAEIYEQVVTLCKQHHALLHKVYGLRPLLGTAAKQASWVQKQREKYGIKSVDNGEAESCPSVHCDGQFGDRQ